MSRHTLKKKNLPSPDPIYNSRLINMLSTKIIVDGKKRLAQRIIYDALKIIEVKTGQKPLKIFEEAIKKVTPLIEIKARRIGGSNCQVPVEVRAFRGTYLALKWIAKFSRERSGKKMATKLANEIIDSSNDISNSIKKKDEMHRMAEANKAFARHRFQKT